MHVSTGVEASSLSQEFSPFQGGMTDYLD